MENNNKFENKENKQLYSDIKGTGPARTVIFKIVLTILMFIFSRFTGN